MRRREADRARRMVGLGGDSGDADVPSGVWQGRSRVGAQRPFVIMENPVDKPSAGARASGFLHTEARRESCDDSAGRAIGVVVRDAVEMTSVSARRTHLRLLVLLALGTIFHGGRFAARVIFRGYPIEARHIPIRAWKQAMTRRGILGLTSGGSSLPPELGE